MTDTATPSCSISSAPPRHPAPERAFWVLKMGCTLDTLRASQGDFEDWIAAGLQAGSSTCPVHVLDGSQADHPHHTWPALEATAGVVVTGSHAMVSDRAPWSEACAQWLQQLVQAQVPLLGICFGHQLLAHALGGAVGPHPQGLELGTVTVNTHTQAANDPLLQGLPPQFLAHTVHYQSVLALPPGAQALAFNAHDPHHAFRAGPRAWGVQFHPEFSQHAMQGYVDYLRPSLPSHAAGTVFSTTPTPEASRLLARFAQLASAPVL